MFKQPTGNAVSNVLKVNGSMKQLHKYVLIVRLNRVYVVKHVRTLTVNGRVSRQIILDFFSNLTFGILPVGVLTGVTALCLRVQGSIPGGFLDLFPLNKAFL